MRATGVMDQDQCIRTGSMQQRQRHRGESRVSDAALSFDEAYIAVSGAEDQFLNCSRGKVRGDRVDRHTRPGDHHACLSGLPGNKHPIHVAEPERSALKAATILPTFPSVPIVRIRRQLVSRARPAAKTRLVGGLRRS